MQEVYVNFDSQGEKDLDSEYLRTSKKWSHGSLWCHHRDSTAYSSGRLRRPKSSETPGFWARLGRSMISNSNLVFISSRVSWWYTRCLYHYNMWKQYNTISISRMQRGQTILDSVEKTKLTRNRDRITSWSVGIRSKICFNFQTNVTPKYVRWKIYLRRRRIIIRRSEKLRFAKCVKSGRSVSNTTYEKW